MSVLDGLTKQLNGRGLPGKDVLEGAAWFGDLHKHLGAFTDDLEKWAGAPNASSDEVQKFLQKLHDAGKALVAHLGGDATALGLVTAVQNKRNPEDSGLDFAARAAADPAKVETVMGALSKKVLDCGVNASAWATCGIPGHLKGILESAWAAKMNLEALGTADRLTDGVLDDRLFEAYNGATGTVGNRHLLDQKEGPGLIAACAKLLKQMKREMMVIKAS